MAVFPGERLVAGDRCPLLVHEAVPQAINQPGPLVVFLPGAIHTARVAYGHPGSDPIDFISHWLVEYGHPVLAVSYPVEPGDPVFDAVDADLTLADVTVAVADEVAGAVDRLGVEREVVVAAWSALGNSAPLLARALAAHDVELGTFLSLAATPPLPNLILGSLEASGATVGHAAAYRADGLLRHDSLRSSVFVEEIAALGRAAGEVVISEADYRAHYLGDMPLGIFPGLEAQRSPGSNPVAPETSVIVGHNGPLTASGGSRWHDYPVVASIAPTIASDWRHALTDRFNWAMVTANALAWSMAAEDRPTDPERWDRVVALTHRLCLELHVRQPGGHFFFVGRSGARAAAGSISGLDRRRRRLQRQLRAELDGP